jgi:hypothetical protein
LSQGSSTAEIIGCRDPHPLPRLLLRDRDLTTEILLPGHRRDIFAALAGVEKRLKHDALDRHLAPMLAVGGDLDFFPGPV